MPPPLLRGSRYTLSLPTAFSLIKRFGVLLSFNSTNKIFGLAGVNARPLQSSYTATNGPHYDHEARGMPGQLLGELMKRQFEGNEGTSGTIGNKEFALKLVLSILFVLLGGVFSGLSLGLMGLDQMNLKVLATAGSPQDRSDARRVLSLLSHGRHFVLVCLLLSNVIVNETLPIFLDQITGGGGILAVVISSALIFFAGEVIPQSLCAQHGLRIGAKCTDFVRILMYLESPVCWPTAKLLDWLLGSNHSHAYRREELKTLIELHSAEPPHHSPYADTTQDEALNEVEVNVAKAALSMRDHLVKECMKKMEDVYTVNDGMRICDVELKELLLRSQAYIPVRRSKSSQYTSSQQTDQGVYVGLITVHQLVAALSTPNETIRTLRLVNLVQVLPSTSLTDCISYLNENDRATVFLISNSSIQGGDALGFATIDDISRFLLDRSERTSGERSPILTRPRIARGKGGSISLGIGAFVRGVVERHRTHRASASELSFRLSSDDSDPSYEPLRASHSHHRINSQTSIPPTRTISHNRPASFSSKQSGLGKSGSFQFPSPVFEETENFALGDEETDDDMSLSGHVPAQVGMYGYELVDRVDSSTEKEPLAGGRIK
ncbi:hypothetical protein JCM5353_000464 [Sporobolomyces roseus]